MANPNLFDIYFSGQLLPDTDEATARAKIGAMFKANEKQIAKLFSGKPKAIKRSVNMDKAVKYRLAFRDIGALVDIKPAGAVIKEVKKPKSKPVENGEEIVITAPVATTEDEEIVITAPVSTTEDEEIVITAPVSTTEDEEIVITDSVDAESEFQEPLEVKIAHLSLAPIGSDILPEKKTIKETVSFDTSSLEILPVNQGTLEDFSIEKEPINIPDVSHLSAKDPTK